MSNRSDTFDRSNGSLGTPSDAGSAWSDSGGTGSISSNEFLGINLFAWTPANLETSTAVGKIAATVKSLGNSGIGLRYVDSSNFWMVQIQSTGLGLYKRVSGTFTLYGSAYTGTISVGDVIEVEVTSGNVWTVKQNGTLRINPGTADSAHSTATKLLIANYSGSSRYDDLSFTDTAGGGSTITASATLDAAIQAAQSATATIAAAIQAARSATASVAAAIQAPGAATATLAAAVQTPLSASASIAAAVQAANTLQAALNAALQAGNTAQASLDAYIQAGFVASASIDAAIQAARSGSASIDAAIQVARAATADLTAAIAVNNTVGSAVSAVVLATRGWAVNLDAYIEDPDAPVPDAPGQVYGGRRRTHRVDDLTEDQVREHWDLLETRLKPRPDSTAPAVEQEPSAQPAPEARTKTLSAPAGQPVSPEARAAIAKSGVTAAGPDKPSAEAPAAQSVDAGAASISDAVRQARRAAEEALIFSLLQ